MHFRSEVRLIPEIIHHLIGSGGKRFRPLLLWPRPNCVVIGASAAIPCRPSSSLSIRPPFFTTM